MMNETMNVQERIEAAVSLEYVDRHPVFPIIITAAPRLCNHTQGEAWRNHNVARESIIKCHHEYGYDVSSKPNYYYPQLPGKFLNAPVFNLIPGKQLAEDDLYQIKEVELFSRKDYDKIASLGWNNFWIEHYSNMKDKSLEQLTSTQEVTNKIFHSDMKICEDQGVPILVGSYVDSTMMAFSLCRTLTEFTRDLHEIPDKVEAAMEATCDDLIANAIELCKSHGKKYIFVVLERGSGFYYRPNIFERFEWPYLQRYVDAFVSEGITPWLHFDTDWSINLPYLKNLPKGKCICDLDGTTDIYNAKKILNNHMCISGDVPAALLTLGKPEEVEAYCKELIDVVGFNGGFMLTTGCECPIDVKSENLMTMIEVGKQYKGKNTLKVSRKKVEIKDREKEEATMTLQADSIKKALVELDADVLNSMVEQAIKGGADPFTILEECKEGMNSVGNLYSEGSYFLSELIISGELFKNAARIIQPFLLAKQETDGELGTVVIGTPQGDIHDLGKNIVSILFESAGFNVTDLGVDVKPESFIEAIQDTGANVVAMSALITPTFQTMKTVVDLMRDNDLREGKMVIIGGGPTTENVRTFVGADIWTLDPSKGVAICKEFVMSRLKNN